METFWSFFDRFDEIVYAADMDSYEMIYLNPAGLRAYGLSDLSQVVGRKCYELLQNNNAPCAMCTNPRLREDCFIKWQYFNPTFNRYVRLKDTMVTVEGRRCRIEIAAVAEKDERTSEVWMNALGEDIGELAQESFRVAMLAPTPDQSLDLLLEYLGHALQAERIYIFEENSRGNHDNTYEWVATGVSRQIDNLQDIPPSVTEGWYQAFRKDDTVIIKNLEDIRESDPLMYAVLRPQDIHSLVTGPLYDGDRIIGFYGVDNPPKELLQGSSSLIKIMGQFVGMFLKVRNLVRDLRYTGHHDQLTGLGNRHAYIEALGRFDIGTGVGVLFCDVTGLKAVNDASGHQAGDELLVRAAKCLTHVFPPEQIFRVGGDELVVVCANCSGEAELAGRLKALRSELAANDVNLSIGTACQMCGPLDLELLVAEAEQRMYADKALYYSTSGRDRRRTTDWPGKPVPPV